ncbi:AAA family ATPase [Legionella maioricensis]|uniref:ATP-binding protein n=1 Tax=Legionella maioricensis TaxID=2896528 RepID=A0A9X2D462_9GAMM|nr:ATP-binding protein [Legionella maioricensis]MCL9685227.1 ATP-binding protein [Legionella maioricensis]MCL9688444.1 ATP-binding protein [Legionella maioricensis]
MIQTNWYVITGGPSSGKTTLINQLAAAGYSIAPEVAREYIEKLLANNHTLADIRRDTHQLQRAILAFALKRERHLKSDQLIFFDRGTADSLGYFHYYNLDSARVTQVFHQTRYKKIFYCHQLPIEYDAVRVEDNLSAKKIGELIYDAYIKLDYQLIELPAIPVEQRMEILLSHIQSDLKQES